MARVVVTGAAGFIGRALVVQLLDEGHEVVAGYHSSAPHLESHPRLLVTRMDVNEPRQLADAMRNATHVAHLGAQKSKPGATMHAYDRTNVAGTCNVYAAAQAAGVERMVFASTLGVHGFVDGEQVTEDSPCRPNTGYRWSKLKAEQALAGLATQRATPGVVTVRLSTTVGPGATSWRPFIAGVQAGTLRLIGDGSNCIDLVALSDVTNALIRCLFTPGIDGRTFVLGAAQPTTVRQFADWVADTLGVPRCVSGPPRWPYRLLMHTVQLLRLRQGPISTWVHSREALVADKRVSSARAQREFGYSPASDVQRAAQCMVEWELARQ